LAGLPGKSLWSDRFLTRLRLARDRTGLFERPILSLFLDDVHLAGEKGLTISNATVTANASPQRLPRRCRSSCSTTQS